MPAALMTPPPAVSILMPVRDAQATLPAALESIQSQTLRDWELIAVDDGSQDESGAWLRRAAVQDARIRVHHTAPQGIAHALQSGLTLCRADLIARMDADDWMHPQRLERQLTHLASHPDTGLVSCRVRYQGSGAGYAEHVAWINALLTHEDISLRRFVEAPVAHPSVMFRRSVIAQQGGWRAGDFPEDYELWLRWLEAGVRFEKVPVELLIWNDPPERLSRTDPRYAVDAFYQIKAAYLARWLHTHVPHSRTLWLWGAGRITRRRFSALAQHGIHIGGFIDVDPALRGSHRDGRPVRLVSELPEKATSYILAGVAARGAREKIHTHLTAHGWCEGADFLLAA